MIRYALSCENGHAFDAWFRSSDDFDRQAEAGAVGCPDCASTVVRKALMAPGVPAKANAKAAPAEAGPRAFFNAVRDYRAKVMAGTTDVGEAFPATVREMHDGTREHEPVRGVASPEEAKALKEEGIGILPVPPEPPTEN